MCRALTTLLSRSSKTPTCTCDRSCAAIDRISVSAASRGKGSTAAHIASSVLLDRCMTFGAFFRVCRDPIASLRVIGALLQPTFDDRAAAGPVVRLTATEAERMVAVAFHCRNDGVQLPWCDCAFDRELAVWGRAPFEMRIVVYVSTIEQRAITVRQRQTISARAHVMVFATMHRTPCSPIENIS